MEMRLRAGLDDFDEKSFFLFLVIRNFNGKIQYCDLWRSTSENEKENNTKEFFFSQNLSQNLSTPSKLSKMHYHPHEENKSAGYNVSSQHIFKASNHSQ